jgi:hypothetical protein
MGNTDIRQFKKLKTITSLFSLPRSERKKVELKAKYSPSRELRIWCYYESTRAKAGKS